MAQGVLMPKEGITVESCIIGEWKVNVGDTVNVGDVLFTYETDKAEFECVSTAAGTLLEKFYEDGDEVPVLINVCAVGNPGEDVSALKGVGGNDAPAAEAAPAAAAPAASAPVAAVSANAAQGVLMPKEGITVESCIMGEWKVNVGDTVNMGDVLFSYETDKAEFECISTAAGTLLAKFYEEGDEVPVLINVCAVGNPGQDFECLKGIGGTPAAAEAPVEAPAAAAAPAAAVAAGPIAQPVIMPKEGITVESCIMGEWQKNVGDQIAVGDVLFSYETDKAEFECVSTAAGTLLAKFYEAGDEVECLINVCAVGKAGDEFECLKGVSGMPEVTVVAAAPVAADEDVSNDGSPISPRARALAVKANVDLSGAKGTGPNGRIIERDVRKLMEEGKLKKAEVAEAPAAAAPVAAPAAAAAAPAPAAAEYEDVKFNAVRKATAKSMMKSLSSMAQLTVHFSFDATQIQSYRKMLKGMEGPMSKISLNDMVMFAITRTILNHPNLNANMLEENVVRQFKTVNLGFACDTEKGLLVPVINGADKMSLLELSMAAKALAADARDGKLGPDKMGGGTFTVSNIGSFGCECFTPVINPPQTGILGICNIETKIKGVNNGQIETYPAMGLSLTFDHRVVDGAPASRFMQELCKNLENFLTLLAK